MAEEDAEKRTRQESLKSPENHRNQIEKLKEEDSTQYFPTKGDKFEPVDLEKEPHPDSGLPEIWTIVQSTPANFVPQYFLDVSRNLLENPNLTASHLSRAELSYKSFTDASFNPHAQHPYELASIIKHLKPEHQPLLIPRGFEGYTLEWTVVRKLIPRNPKLDAPLLQTCHLYTSTSDITVQVEEEDGGSNNKTLEAERYLVVYLPHVSDPEEIPFYHPKVKALAILYTYLPSAPPTLAPGTLSIYYTLFPTHPISNRLSRTGLKMLEIIHKHSRGRAAGYTKRVHHDIIIGQKPFQETYAYLKGKYAKQLIDNWVEQTPAGKHVFEDLGIAAFLIELWTDMYGSCSNDGKQSNESTYVTQEDDTKNAKEIREVAKKAFPGFVDIGCGNGLLVYILNLEGWPGWGFDARRRKTWQTFGPSYAEKLKDMLLVPEILQTGSTPTSNPSNATEEPEGTQTQPQTFNNAPLSHNGIFPKGTFIVSNHADELTPWTPLLAYLSDSPFIAIPCCSHDFGGTRFRAPSHAKYLPHSVPDPHQIKVKPPSAYASLCSYVAYLTAQVGYVPEREHLRIPSTRNIAVVGRERQESSGEEAAIESFDEKMEFVQELVEKEMGGETSINQVRLMWLRRGAGLVKPGKGGGH